jgi:hypothetical protein
MKLWASTLWLLAALVLCGCGRQQTTSGSTPGSPPPPPPQVLNVTGNWQFNSSPTVAGTPAIAVAGGLNQSDNSISGAVHVDGSKCFDPPTTVNLTGAVANNSNITLTSAPVAGQVITFTGTSSDYTFNGTYSISGGCADGEQGKVAGTNVPYMEDNLSGTFTNSGGNTFDATGSITQGGANSDGSFGISGTAAFQTSCFPSGTVISGELSGGSYILGTAVALVIDTGNGTLAFLGTEDAAGDSISGSYTVTGGTCDQTGTAVLALSNPWDY